MDFSLVLLDDATAALRREMCEWLDEQVTPELIEAEWRNGDGHNAKFHQALGAKGWAFPGLPANEGGAGLTELQCQILELELAKRHVPVNTRETTAIVMPAIRRWMSGSFRDALLMRAARGDVCFCLGYTEPEAGSDLASVRTRATRETDSWIISGQKMFTTGAQNCDYSFLVARTNQDVQDHRGLTMFLVPLRVEGVEVREVKTLGGERTNIVFYDNVRISDEHRVGPEGEGWTVLHGPLNAEHRMSDSGPQAVEEESGEAGSGRAADLSTHMLRVHEPAVEAAVEWAQRRDANGRRPINETLVRRRLAEVELGLVVSKITPGPHGRVISADLIIRNAAELVDLLGPDALLAHGQPSAVASGWIEYAHRFSQGCAIYGGTTEIFRNIIAERFLRLGRSTSMRSSPET